MDYKKIKILENRNSYKPQTSIVPENEISNFETKSPFTSKLPIIVDVSDLSLKFKV